MMAPADGQTDGATKLPRRPGITCQGRQLHWPARGPGARTHRRASPRAVPAPRIGKGSRAGAEVGAGLASPGRMRFGVESAPSTRNSSFSCACAGWKHPGAEEWAWRWGVTLTAKARSQEWNELERIRPCSSLLPLPFWHQQHKLQRVFTIRIINNLMASKTR